MLPSDGGSSGATRNGLPWPEGNPESIAHASRSAHGAAATLRTGVGRVEAAASAASGWQGAGAAAFRGAVAGERTAMLRGAHALEEAAGALRRLSTRLDEAQRTVTRLAGEVEDAEQAAQAAEARASIEQLNAVAAEGMLLLAGPNPSHSLEAGAGNAMDDASAAATTAGNARAAADAIRAKNTKLAQQECDDVLRVDVSTASAVNNAASAAPFTGAPAGTPTPAQGFATNVLSGLSHEQWLAIGYWSAGIDGDNWDPNKGLLANDDTVQRVYALYGRLFNEHPELQWAGMANIVGPMFYAGWQDIYTVRHVMDPGERADLLFQLSGLGSLPGFVKTGADLAGHLPIGPLAPAELAGHLGNDELEWNEHQFLTMQKAIYDDLAWKHVAYSIGGIGLMRQLASEGQLGRTELAPWENIASGDPGRIADGNEALLRREQEQIVQPYYDEMRNHHGVSGDVFTYTSTVMAEDPVPGGHAYRDLYRLHVQFDAPTPQVPFTSWPPQPHVDISTPLPDGNLSNFDDRWRWIQQDMLPHYRELLTHPAQAHALVSQDVAGRAEQWRKLPDLPYPGG
jgi:uncharacterized protein YukE